MLLLGSSSAWWLTVHEGDNCTGDILDAEKNTEDTGCKLIHTNTPQHSIKVKELASSGNGYQQAEFCTNTDCSDDPDISIAVDSPDCVNINRRQYAFRIVFIPNTPPTAANKDS